MRLLVRVLGRRTGVDVRAALRVRQVANVVNLATPLGVLAAVAGRARLERGPDGLLLA
ncbi:MAG: hypothetical protein H0U35_09820, partial [Sporichthyaceae bacterium]|nr:hypothetical protein [Sporichthyaceae bacterium]